jgi:hypothetical protein
MRRLLAVVLFLTTSGCAVHGLSFDHDDRLDIISPRDRAKVDLPVTVRWTVEDFAVGDREGSFAVALDATPPRSGQTLPGMFRKNATCRGEAGRTLCASPEFLAQHGLFRTTDREFTIERVAKLSGNDRRRQFHELTVVLLDREGRRAGEGAWSVQFSVEDQT